MRKSIITLLILCIFPCYAWGDGSLTAEETVKQYCKLDFEGARLSGQTWSESGIDKLYEWKQHEFAWDTITITKDYQIQDAIQKGNNATVIVQFTVLGEHYGYEWTPVENMSKGKAEEKIFTLERKNDQWKIVDPMYQPHVSVKALLPHLAGLIEFDKKNNDIRKGLVESYNALSKLVN